MRTIAGICAVLVCCGATRSQSVGSFEAFGRDSLGYDTLRFFVEEAVFFKLSSQKPVTLIRQTRSGASYLDEKSRRPRLQFLGRNTFTLYPSRRIARDFQLHAFLELTGLATYLSMRVGAGVTSRELGATFGLATGTYLKRTLEVPDITYKAKAFEQAVSYGAYVYIDREHLFWFGSMSREKRGVYHRVEFGYKPGYIFGVELLEPIRVFMRSETYLGSGAGLAYMHPGGHFDVACAYLSPDWNERLNQTVFGNHTGRGIEFTARFRWF